MYFISWHQVPDVYPIQKFPEVKHCKKYVCVRQCAHRPPPDVVVQSSESTNCEESVEGGGVRGKGVQQQIQLDQVEDEFAQRVRFKTIGSSLKPESVHKTQSIEK